MPCAFLVDRRLPLPEGYAGKCHLCVDVRRHLLNTGEFEELRPAGFYDNFWPRIERG